MREYAQLVRNSRYQQLAEGIKRTDRRELERHQMGFAEWQLLQHGVRCLSVGHIQDEDDTRRLPPNTTGRSCHRDRAARSREPRSAKCAEPATCPCQGRRCRRPESWWSASAASVFSWSYLSEESGCPLWVRNRHPRSFNKLVGFFPAGARLTQPLEFRLRHKSHGLMSQFGVRLLKPPLLSSTVRRNLWPMSNSVLFECRNCAAKYEIVRVEAPPGPMRDREI